MAQTLFVLFVPFVSLAQTTMEYVLQIFDLPLIGLSKLASAAQGAAIHVHDHFIPHHRNNYHPYALRHRSLGLFSIALISFKIFIITLVSVGPVIPAFSSAITEQNVISLTNQSRADFSLPALTENNLLDQAAQTKANDMLAKGYFSHNTPDGKTPWDFITAAGYNYITAGENLAVNFTQAENVEQAWMNSPGHRANLLNKNYEEIGIGISQGTYQGHDAIFIVQMFGTKMDQKISLLKQPTIVQSSAPTVPTAVPVVRKAPVKAVSVKSQQPVVTQVKPATIVVEPAPVNELEINNPQVNLQNDQVQISAKLSDNTVKAEAIFGQQAIMLSPKEDGTWQGEIAISKLALGSLSVRLTSFDLSGKTKTVPLADFANNIVSNYNLAGTTPATKVSLFGKIFNPKTLEYKVYLYFIAAMLAALGLAIGIKRHIQHVGLIANTSFVVILACMLWMGG